MINKLVKSEYERYNENTAKRSHKDIHNKLSQSSEQNGIQEVGKTAGAARTAGSSSR